MWKPILARLWFGRRAAKAVQEARSDLATLGLARSVERRRERPVARRRRPWAARALAREVSRAVERSGEPARCLVRAVALFGELRSLGYAAEVVIGFESASGMPAGHAWLRVDGAPFLEPATATAGFAEVVAAGAGPAPACHPGPRSDAAAPAAR